MALPIATNMAVRTKQIPLDKTNTHVFRMKYNKKYPSMGLYPTRLQMVEYNPWEGRILFYSMMVCIFVTLQELQ